MSGKVSRKLRQHVLAMGIVPQDRNRAIKDLKNLVNKKLITFSK